MENYQTKLFNVKGNLTNYGKKSSVSFSLIFNETAEKLLVLVNLTVPNLTVYSEHFNRDVYLTKLDVQKVMEGKNSNNFMPFMTFFLNVIVKAFKPSVSFPVQKGVYELKNLTIPDLPLPSQSKRKIKFYGEIKIYLKTERLSKVNFVSKFLMKGTLTL